MLWINPHIYKREHKGATLLICHTHTDRCKKKSLSNEAMVHLSPNISCEVSWSNPQTHERSHWHYDIVISSFKTYTLIDEKKKGYNEHFEF